MAAIYGKVAGPVSWGLPALACCPPPTLLHYSKSFFIPKEAPLPATDDYIISITEINLQPLFFSLKEQVGRKVSTL